MLWAVCADWVVAGDAYLGDNDSFNATLFEEVCIPQPSVLP